MSAGLDTYGLQSVVIDGFADFIMHSGIWRMTAYRLSVAGERIPVLVMELTLPAREQVRDRILGVIGADASEILARH
jgi:hypothetical protein